MIGFATVWDYFSEYGADAKTPPWFGRNVDEMVVYPVVRFQACKHDRREKVMLMVEDTSSVISGERTLVSRTQVSVH